MKRSAKITLSALLLAPLLLLAVLWGAVSWLQATEAGSRFLVQRVLGALEGRAQVESVGGNLANGLVLEGVTWSDGELRLEVPEVELQTRVQWIAPTVIIESLRIREPALTLPGSDPAAPTDTAADVDLASVLRSLALPIRVELREGRLLGLQMRDAAGEPILRLEEVTARVAWHRDLEDLEVTLLTPGVEARAFGRIPLAGADGGHDLTLEGRVDASVFAEHLPTDLRFAAQLAAEGKRLPFDLMSESGGLEVTGVLLEPLGAPSLEARFGLERWPPQPVGPGLVDVRGTVTGDWRHWRLDTEGGLIVPEADAPVQWRLEGGGGPEALQIEALDATADWLQGQGSGRVAWGEQPRLEAEFSWRDLHWPPQAEVPQLVSQEGQARLSGLPEDWSLSGAFDLQTPDYPGGRFDITGAGGLLDGHFELLGGWLGGRLESAADLSWDGPLGVRAEIDARQLDLTALLRDGPVTADLAGVVQFRAADLAKGEKQRLEVDLRRLAGRYRDRPLSGKGQLSLEGNRLRLNGIELRSGDSWLTADGVLARGLDNGLDNGLDDGLDNGPGNDMGLSVAADLRARDLPSLLPEPLGGELRGGFRFSPSRAQPFTDLTLEGRRLRYGAFRVAALDASQAGGQGGGAILVEATDLSYGSQALQSAQLELFGGRVRQRAQLLLAMDGHRLDLSLDGAFVDPKRPAAGWSGALHSLTLEDGEQQLLALREPAPLSWRDGGYGLEDACLLLPEEGALCLDVRSTHVSSAGPAAAAGLEAGLQLSVLLERVPVDATRYFLQHDLELTQYLDGQLVWDHRPGRKPSGHADIRISEGCLCELGDADGKIATGEGRIAFRMDRGDLTGGEIDLPFPGEGEVDIDFDISGVALDGTGQIRGEALLEFNDLSFLEALTAFYENIGGRLETRLKLSGTVGDPALNGRFALRDVRFDAPALGTGIREGELTGTVDASDELLLRGRFLAGEGEGRVEVLASFADLDNLEVHGSLSGEGLQAADLQTLRIRVDPDVTLDRVRGVWRIGGKLAVPSARIAPVTNFTSRVSESPDLQVVAGERSPVLQERQRDELVLGGELAIEMGDDVRLEVDEASVALGGRVNLAWRGAAQPFADGTVSVNGSATVWGPRLDIRGGSVRWPGVPLDNPVLNITAEREVFGNTVVRAAGVRIGGTARRPDVEPYTVPFTSRERAWGVLLTGSDVQFGQGVGALDVGTYIAPRVFLSYGISFFDNDNVVGIRYDLPRRGWGIKATSGQRESGVDLAYTIELGKGGSGEEAETSGKDQ